MHARRRPCRRIAPLWGGRVQAQEIEQSRCGGLSGKRVCGRVRLEGEPQPHNPAGPDAPGEVVHERPREGCGGLGVLGAEHVRGGGGGSSDVPSTDVLFLGNG